MLMMMTENTAVSSSSGHVEVVCLLLDYEVELSLVDNQRLSPIACAKLYGQSDAEKILRERKV